MKRVMFIAFATMFFLAAEMSACDQLMIVPQFQASSAVCTSVQPQAVVQPQVAYAQIVQPTIAVTQLVVPQVQYVQAVAVRAAVYPQVVHQRAVCVNGVSVGCNAVQPFAVQNVVNVQRQGLFANIRARIDERRADRGRQVVRTRTVVRGRR